MVVGNLGNTIGQMNVKNCPKPSENIIASMNAAGWSCYMVNPKILPRKASKSNDRPMEVSNKSWGYSQNHPPFSIGIFRKKKTWHFPMFQSDFPWTKPSILGMPPCFIGIFHFGTSIVLQSPCGRGWIKKNHTKSYRMGPPVFELAWTVGEHFCGWKNYGLW